ncbi:MAG: DUF4910 domain-containing protein [Candidatus Asgardarchaeia archaeon]
MSIEKLIKLVSDELSGNYAKRNVSEISNFHRIQASPGIKEAVMFVASKLEEFGIKHEVLSFKSDGEKKYLGWRSPVGWEAKRGYIKIVSPREKLLGSFEDTPTCVVAYSAPTPPEGLEAEVVYVGRGIREEDYGGKDLKGKFVLSYGPPYDVFLEAAVKRGAAGLIFYNDKMVDTPDAVRYYGIWIGKSEIEKMVPAFSISLRDAKQILNMIEMGKTVKVRAFLDARFFEGEVNIVTGVIEGETDEEILLTAHICHPNPGANDNASGSGLLLEIARTIKNMMDKKLIDRPKRTIRFMWVPEMLGIAAFLDANPDYLDKLLCGINLDMVGEDQERYGSVLTIVSTPYSLPSALPSLVYSILEKVVNRDKKQFGGIERLPSLRYKMTSYVGGSDHYVFVNFPSKRPFVSLISWPDIFWHTSEDTIDKVSEKTLKMVGVAACSAALLLASPSEELGIWLASKVCSRGINMLKDTLGKYVEEMENEDDPRKRTLKSKLALIRMTHIFKYAVESLVSVRDIFSSETVKEVLDSMVEQINRVYENDSKTLDRIMSKYGIDINKYELDEYEMEAKKIIPVRKVREFIHLSELRRKLRDEDRAKMIRLSMEEETLFTLMDEVLNYMDGKTNLLDIAYTVSSLYTPISIKNLILIVKLLEKYGYIKISKVEDEG